MVIPIFECIFVIRKKELTASSKQNYSLPGPTI